MPLPSVEPMPPVARLERFTEPLEAQEASYFAASERIDSFRCRVSRVMCSLYVRMTPCPRGFRPINSKRHSGSDLFETTGSTSFTIVGQCVGVGRLSRPPLTAYLVVTSFHQQAVSPGATK